MRALPLLLLASCCAGPTTEALLTSDEAGRLAFAPSGPVAADADGALLAAHGGGIARLDPASGSFEEILLEPAPGLADLDFAASGTLCVLHGDRLSAFFGGKLLEMARLPARGARLACGNGLFYLALDAPGGGAALCRYRRAEGRLETLFESDRPIGALAAVPGGCLFSVGASVYKFYDPAADAEETAAEARLLLLVAVDGGPITSLAADPERRVLYFADERSTFAWASGAVIPFAPLGGTVRLSDRALSIVSPRTRQAWRILDAAGRVDEILRSRGR